RKSWPSGRTPCRRGYAETKRHTTESSRLLVLRQVGCAGAFSWQRAKSANDPKLSDRGVRRGTCMAGGKAAAEAGAVTHGAVRCSAWLGRFIWFWVRLDEFTNDLHNAFRGIDCAFIAIPPSSKRLPVSGKGLNPAKRL